MPATNCLHFGGQPTPEQAEAFGSSLADWPPFADSAAALALLARRFELALARIGRPPERILHVAQSLFHDHVPARQLGLAMAWVNRRGDRAGFGATPPAAATPDLIVPDIASLAEMAVAGRTSTSSVVDG